VPGFDVCNFDVINSKILSNLESKLESLSSNLCSSASNSSFFLELRFFLIETELAERVLAAMLETS
jgi:hypothetical protein